LRLSISRPLLVARIARTFGRTRPFTVANSLAGARASVPVAWRTLAIPARRFSLARGTRAVPGTFRIAAPEFARTGFPLGPDAAEGRMQAIG
jgi:hypothetical protein